MSTAPGDDRPERVPPGRVNQRLARLGFSDPDHAAAVLAAPPLQWWDPGTNEPVDAGAAAGIASLGRTPDPDLALHALADLARAVGQDRRLLLAALETSGQVRSRLVNLLGESVELGAHLVAYSDHWQVVLRDDYDAAGVAGRLAAAVGADPHDPVTGTAGRRTAVGGAEAVALLRAAYRRELADIAGRDMAGDLGLRAVTEVLADLAGHTLQTALAVAAYDLRPEAAPCRLAIIAMGKTGGRELNYVSDVDVIFVAEPGEHDDPAAEQDTQAALSVATTLASATMRICRAVAWEVDANLRPEGKDGPLVRTLASHDAYYRRWASTWEFQALLKLRPVAGDAELGRRYLRTLAPLVWSASERPDFVTDVQAMRRRVLAHVPSAIADREIKLGRGGLRDVEFAVQLLQLVHGRGDEALRESGATLAALAALRDGGYVGRDDAVSLADAYSFLRATEHRLQLRRLRRTHLLPDDPTELTRLARAMGYRPDARGDARAVFEAERALHVREVSRLHEKLFYRPLLESVARVPTQALRLTPAEAGRRLAALGFADPPRALRHIEALTSGLRRRAALQRALLPVMLNDFADAPDPDAGLLAYRRVSDELGGTPWFLRLLRDEGQVASRLAFLLGTSRYVAGMLERAPEALRLLADDAALVPRPEAELHAVMVDAIERQDDATEAVQVVRGLRRQELLRTAFADLLGRLAVVEVGQAITVVTEATLDAALHAARRSVARELDVVQLPIDFAVISMGRLGGSEAGYGSDADVLFVYESRDPDLPDEAAARIAQHVASRLRSLLSAPSADPPLGVDANLRPEGRSGPLARSLASYAGYYTRWSSAWEAQALLRARFAVGDRGLGERFTALIDPVRYPEAGVSADDLAEIRRLKSRIDTERLPRGADPSTHLKLGRGGLADIEWTVQLLQLAHGAAVPALRTPRTLDALRSAADAGLLGKDDADALAAAWQLASHARNAVMLVRDKADDQLPTQGVALVGVGRALGYAPGFDPGQLIDDYRRVARRARRVVERVFYSSASSGSGIGSVGEGAGV
jgi:[glutamine synthetase] adenylyltransferase / [glutamine synthetase]-adenylyl-L-tyrosine phosphorylase